jgi:hypothetical protein
MSALIGAAIAGNAYAGLSCHNINAKGVGQTYPDLSTTASVIGGGLLNGTTAAQFAPSGDAANGVLPFTGTIKFTTKQGTVSADLTGGFDVGTGEFNAKGSFIPATATGKLAGAMGTIALQGSEDMTTHVFIEDITGSICVNLAP